MSDDDTLDPRPTAAEIAARVGIPGPRDSETPGKFLQRLRDHKPPSDRETLLSMLQRAGISAEGAEASNDTTVIAMNRPRFYFDATGRLREGAKTFFAAPPSDLATFRAMLERAGIPFTEDHDEMGGGTGLTIDRGYPGFFAYVGFDDQGRLNDMGAGEG